MNTRLIIVEGIPGSGKTTTAKRIRDWIDGKGMKPLLYLEDSSDHPVDLDNLSYFDEEQYQRFVEKYSDYQQTIEKVSEKSSDGYFVFYRQLHEMANEKIPEDLFAILYAHDAHDTLPPEKYRALLLERWRRFSAQALENEVLTIFECCFLQNPLTIFIGKHNHEVNEVKQLIFELAKIIEELNPILICLQGKSVRETIKRAVIERPQEWIDHVEAYITGQGYGKAHNLSGQEGIFHFYEMMQKTEAEIMGKLDWRILTVDNSEWNWERHNQEIEKFLMENEGNI